MHLKCFNFNTMKFCFKMSACRMDVDTIPPPAPDTPENVFPKPDFTPVTPDHPGEPIQKTGSPSASKPTFKNALQAKKRLQAFSSNRIGSLPLSPSQKKAKVNLALDEKNKGEEDLKKSLKKGTYFS